MYQAGDPFPHPAFLDNYRTVLNQRITLSDYQGVEVRCGHPSRIIIGGPVLRNSG